MLQHRDGPRPSIRSDRRTVMTTSLSNHGASARPVDGFDEDPTTRTTPTRRGCAASAPAACRPAEVAVLVPARHLQRADGLHGLQRRPRRQHHPPVPAPSSAAMTRHPPRSAADAALISAYSSSSDFSGGTTGRGPRSARRRSSTPVTPPSWPGAARVTFPPEPNPANLRPNSAPPTPAGRCGGWRLVRRAGVLGRRWLASRPP